MEIRKYRAKPAEIEAVQVTEQNIIEVAKWCRGPVILPYWVNVPTAHGLAECRVGDWVAKGPIDFYPIRADAFAERWEEVVESESSGSGPS